MSRTKPAAAAFLTRALLTGLFAIVGAAGAYPLGILVPRPAEFSPIRQGKADVRVEIRNHIARTRVEQEFVNPNPRQLEADFYFPVPKGANVTDFVLYMDGKPVKGEVLEKEKAREIYEGIVRRMRDPGLLEWIDYNLFKVRVFPVPAGGSQRIELEFAQPLEADQGSFKYLFPLRPAKAGTEAGREAPEVRFAVEIRSEEPVRNIYSPSHAVDIDQEDAKAARVKLASGSLAAGGGDFVLYYSVSAKDVALSLLASRSAAEDGFFALMLSPQVKYDESQTSPHDVVFVIDTSGSMLEESKIEQARKALAYCVSQLREQDRFNVIRFSTEVEKFRASLIPASRGAVEEARAWIGALQARGGTNISGALEEALELRRDGSGGGEPAGEGRLYTIVFITDGLPTIGTTAPERILAEVKSRNAKGVRIFAFGVGNDVNAKLLDQIAAETRAASDYIRPGQDMEAPISRFFDKISRPAMTDLRLAMPGAEVFDLYPNEIPDLFFGTQLTVFGRYKKPGATAIKLSGQAAGKPVEFVYEKTLPEKETGNEFVEKLWATRKIGYLLDEIRARGENKELKEEVVALSKRYGIVTPYTSYLVAEDVAPEEPRRRQPPARPLLRDGWSRGPGASPLQSYGSQDASRGAAPAMAPEAGASAPAAPAAPPPSFQDSSGGAAVSASRALRQMKTADIGAKAEEEARSGLRSASGKTFRLENGVWTDTQIAAGEPSALVLRYLSDGYFAALKANPRLGEIFALGERVRVKLAGGIVEVAAEGKEKIDAQDEILLSGQKK